MNRCNRRDALKAMGAASAALLMPRSMTAANELSRVSSHELEIRLHR